MLKVSPLLSRLTRREFAPTKIARYSFEYLEGVKERERERAVREVINKRKKEAERMNKKYREIASCTKTDFRKRALQCRGPNSSNSCNLKRIIKIRKGNARKLNIPLDWHLEKRKREKKKYKKRKRQEKKKRVWWKTRFTHTVVPDIHTLKIDIVLKKLEKERDKLLSLPMEVLQCNSNLAIGGAVLDSGAMRNSGDASKTASARNSRKPLKEQLRVRGVHGNDKPVIHDYVMRVPSAIEGQDIELSKTLDIPGSVHDLVSVGLLDDLGFTTIFKNQEGRVLDKNDKLVMYAEKIEGLYRLRSALVDQCFNHVQLYNTDSLRHYHDALKHMNFNEIRKIFNLPPETKEDLNPFCAACHFAQTRNMKKPSEGLLRAPRFGYRIHSDTSCKMPATKYWTDSGIQRYVLTCDEFTDTLFVNFVARKSDVKRKIVELVGSINNDRSPEGVVEHQTDGGTEFLNRTLDKKLASMFCKPRNSNPHCQYENGLIESHMEDIQRASRAMMFRGNAPSSDWAYAVRHAVYLHDVIPNPLTKLTPFEKRTGVKPREMLKEMSQKVLFGKCIAKVYVHAKMEKDARECIYMGKCPRTTGDLIRVIGGKISGGKILTAKVIKMEHGVFPYTEAGVPIPKQIQSVNYDSDSEEEEDGVTVRGEDERVESSDSEDSLSEDDEERESNNLRSKLKQLYEPNRKEEETEAAQNVIGNQPAFEIEKITGEKLIKGKRGKKSKFYQVKWKGDYPDLDWIHCSQVRAPDLVRNYKQEKTKLDSKTDGLIMRVCQLNQEVEVKPKSLEEVNPFAVLFNPKYDKREKDPRGHKQMLEHKFAEQFQRALLKEKMENKKWNTYVEVLRSSVPKGAKILYPVTAYATKYNSKGEIEKFKSRVCLNGKHTEVDPSETYEAIANTGTIRLLLCLAARYGLGICQTDVKNFFLQAVLPAGKEYYAEIPDGWEENDRLTHLAKVLAPWYGLKESAKLAGDQLAAVLNKAGMEENPYMPKVFFRWEGDDFVACANHIDDGIWIYSSRTLLDKVLDKVDSQFKMTREYNVTKLLGCDIEYDMERGLLKMHQGSYNIAKLKEMNVSNSRPAKSPGHIPANLPNSAFPEKRPQATIQEVRLFQKKVGVHMWGLQTDPSSMFVVHRMASKMLNPQKEDWIEMARFEKYKCTFPEMGVVFRRAANKEKLKKGTNLDCLTYYADADLAGDKRDSKSTSGYCAHLGESGMFDWKSKKQTCVCQSSCESETYSSKECTCHAMWLRDALDFMGFKFTKPTPICQDNQSAIALCESDKHHSRTRHFRMHVALLKDCLRKRITRYPWIPTKFMKGDLFNKAHGPTRHEEMCETNGIYAQRLALVPDDVPLQQIDGWVETIQEQKRLEASSKVQLESKVQEEC